MSLDILSISNYKTVYKKVVYKYNNIHKFLYIFTTLLVYLISLNIKKLKLNISIHKRQFDNKQKHFWWIYYSNNFSYTPHTKSKLQTNKYHILTHAPKHATRTKIK